MIKYKVKIVDIIDETSDVKTYILEMPKDVSWLEAAHMHVAIIGFDKGEEVNKDLVRHLSIASNVDDNIISFTTRFSKDLSLFKKELLKLKVGDELIIFKIENRIKLDREDKDIVLLTQGVAMAIARPMIMSYLKDNTRVKSITLLNINKNEEFIYRDYLSKNAKNKVVLKWINNRDEFYREIDITLHNKNCIYYVVGSDNFLESVVEYLKNNEVNPNYIKLDKKKNKIDELLYGIR